MKETFSQKAGNKVKSIDLMGSSVGFTVDGKDSHKTWLGTCFSFLALIVVIAYTSKRYSVMSEKDDTTFLKTVS